MESGVNPCTYTSSFRNILKNLFALILNWCLYECGTADILWKINYVKNMQYLDQKLML